jgi:hypothetical protein
LKTIDCSEYISKKILSSDGHLTNESWHVLSQQVGRVRPTVQQNQNVIVTDDNKLEEEADIMGQSALLSMNEVSHNKT